MAPAAKKHRTTPLTINLPREKTAGYADCSELALLCWAFFSEKNERRLRSPTLKSRVPNNRRPWQVNYERPWGKWGPGRGLRREGGHRGWGASKRTTPRSKEQMKSDSLPPSPSLPSCPRCSVSSSGWLGRRPFHRNKSPLGGSDGAESIAYWEARTPSLPL